MTTKPTKTKKPAEQVVKDIRRATRRHFSAEDKIRIVLDGLRGEDSIAELCRREGIAQSLYYTWSKEFMEAGKRRLAGDTARAATSDEVKDLRREPHFTLSQVALNDAIMVVAFAPIVGLLLGLSAITVPWGTLLLSVVLYIVIPVIIAQIMRRRLLANGGQAALDRVLARLGPVSLVALLATLVLLFGFQGEQIIAQPTIIALLAVPILIQVYFNSGLAYLLNRMSGEQHCVAGPSALIGASNFFELAVAAAISLFGFHSGAALATVVGVLIEVPVMLSVVWIVNRSKGWYERGGKVAAVAEANR